jgi:hypothetical protein
MLTKHEREKIRASFVEMTMHANNNTSPVVILGDQKRLTPHQIWQLLNAVDETEAENARLRTLIRKLYKLVSLASLTQCDHQCFTAETKSNLFSLLAEAHAATAPRKDAPARVLPDN